MSLAYHLGLLHVPQAENPVWKRTTALHDMHRNFARMYLPNETDEAGSEDRQYPRRHSKAAA